MQLDRYLGLYLSETREHLRVLDQSLLDLESSGGGEAVTAAFRATHTIKGMAATMGFRAVAEAAHRLEDRLDELRLSAASVEADELDTLLALVDTLGAAVEQAAEDPAAATTAAAPESIASGIERPGEAAMHAEEGDSVTTAFPEGTELVVRVVLEEASVLKAARAVLVRGAAEREATVLGSEPEDFDDGFDGELRLFIGAGADRDALGAAIHAAGEVERVEFLEVDRSARREASGAEAGVPAAARFVRVEQRHLVDLADGIADLTVIVGELERVGALAELPELNTLVDRLARRVDDLNHSAMATRMVPAAEVFDRFRRLVRDAARSLGKEVDYALEGADIELDRDILTELADPIPHLLRNAIDHGLESPAERVAAGKPARGQLRLRVTRARSHAVIEVVDDGRGIDRDRVARRAREMGLLDEEAATTGISDEELLRLLSRPGLTTADQVSEHSGRGVGLDAVVNRVRSLGGAITLETAAGEGTRLSLRLPVTLALTQALRVEVGGEVYAIPLTHISEAVDLTRERLETEGEDEVLLLRDERVPLVRLRRVLSAPGSEPETMAVVAEAGEQRAALAVDRLISRDRIVVKGFDAAVGTLPVFSGATLLSDGRPALVLDPISVL